MELAGSGALNLCTLDIWGRIILCSGVGGSGCDWEGGCPVHRRMLSSTAGLSPQDARNTPPFLIMTLKQVS